MTTAATTETRPLSVQLEVAHRQQRRELEEAFAVKTAFMEHEQEGLRNQVRRAATTTSLANLVYVSVRFGMP